MLQRFLEASAITSMLLLAAPAAMIFILLLLVLVFLAPFHLFVFAQIVSVLIL